MELYIHIPFCVKKCDYCDFLSFPMGRCVGENQQVNEYVDALCRELGEISGFPDFDGIDTVFIGGGTPSLLGPEQLERVLKAVQEAVNAHSSADGSASEFPNNTCKEAENGNDGNQCRNSRENDRIEFTVECNPGTLSEEKLLLFKRYGVNRLSIGLQSADDAELKLLGRIHSYEEFENNYRLARELGFKNINIDLISAIPGQSVEAWENTLKKVAELGPEHISAYSLIIEEGTPFYEKYGESDNTTGDKKPVKALDDNLCETGFNGAEPAFPLPSEDEEREMYRVTRELLAGYGYQRYEISNYARKGFECRHNLGYWTGEEYIACGLGASSYLKKNRFDGYCAWLTEQSGRTYQQAPADECGTPAEYTTGCGAQNIKKTDRYVRFKNTDDIASYLADSTSPEHFSIDESLGLEEHMSEFCILALRLVKGIDVLKFNQVFGVDFMDKYGDIVGKYENLGLLKHENDRVFLTEAGFDVSNAVMAEFL